MSTPAPAHRPSALNGASSSTKRPIIALEEHFVSQAAGAAPPHPIDKIWATIPGFGPDFLDRFRDLGPQRIADMDKGQVAMQVVSHGPGDLSAEHCRDCNDQLAEAVGLHPGRFAGFAKLPMQDPVEAAKELRRVCSDTGPNGVKFVGALVDSHTNNGLYFDGPEFDVFWSEAVQQDVPIYLHPTLPSEELYTANKSPHLSDFPNVAIQSFAFGWHSDVAVHVLRLYAAGVFDRFPELKIIIGHMGEMIPYMLQRIERVSSAWEKDRSFRQVWDNNMWLTTSGNWSLDPMACILRNTKHDRIMFSVDYPFGKSSDGLKWLEELEQSGMVGAEELEGIRWKNAARLLKLDMSE